MEQDQSETNINQLEDEDNGDPDVYDYFIYILGFAGKTSKREWNSVTKLLIGKIWVVARNTRNR